MRFLISSFMFHFAVSAMFSQDFSGTWTGVYNGDNVTLELKSTDKINWTGNLNDSHQNYTVAATRSGEVLRGKATETSLGLAFDLTATVKGNSMDLKLAVLGIEMSVAMVRSGADSALGSGQNLQAQATTSAQTGMPSLPKNAQHDPALVGNWKREENYNSGYGNAGFYASNSFLAFNADGTLTDLGSQTVVSGGDFSGNSSSGGGGIVPGVKWYTENKNLYLVATDGSRTETVKLGRYFIENGAMLITADDGGKALFYRQ